jgi:uncharacterized protein
VSRFLVFFAVVLGIVGGVHFYLWARLVRDTQVPFPYRPWASGALVLLAACLPLPFLVARRLPPESARWLVWPAYAWMGFMFLLFVFLVATDLLRLSAFLVAQAGAKAGVAGAAQALDAGRRTLMARVLGGAAGLGAGLVGAAAVGQALRAVKVVDVDVRLARLPGASSGTTIVQISDLHIGATIGRAFIDDVVARCNALAPDIVAITGDLVDGSVEGLWDAVSGLGALKARHGVFFVTGNHEYFSGARQWIEALPRLGIRVLGNERVAIDSGGGGFDLAGVHDHSAGRVQPGHGPDLARALAGRDPGRELVLLAHQPKAVFEAARAGVGLQLSGHTHGGQIWPFSYLVRLSQPYLTGLHRHGDTQIYVNPGTGYWGPPMRLGTRAEITRLRLVSATG